MRRQQWTKNPHIAVHAPTHSAFKLDPGFFFRFCGQSPSANDAEGLLIFTIGFEVVSVEIKGLFRSCPVGDEMSKSIV